MPLGGDPRRARLMALLLLGVAAVLLVSSPTWFAGDRQVVGVAQLGVGVGLAVVGVLLLRRARPR